MSEESALHFSITTEQRDNLYSFINSVSSLIESNDERVIRMEITPEYIRVYSYIKASGSREDSFLVYKDIIISTSSLIDTTINETYNYVLIDIKNFLRLIKELDNDEGVFKCKMNYMEKFIDCFYLTDSTLRIAHVAGDDKLIQVIPLERANKPMELKPICQFEVNSEQHAKLLRLMKTSQKKEGVEIIRISIIKNKVKFDDKKWKLLIGETTSDITDSWIFDRNYIKQQTIGSGDVIIYKLYDSYIVTECKSTNTRVLFSTEIFDF